MADVIDQDRELDKQYTMDKKLTAIKVGDKLKVAVNGVSDQAELYCVERSTNPLVLKFTLMYYGVSTGKEFVASKALNKWEFKS